MSLVTNTPIGGGRELTDALVAGLARDGVESRKVAFYLSDKDFMTTDSRTDLEVDLLWNRAVHGMVEPLVHEITVDGLDVLDNPVERSSDLASARLDHPSGVRTPGTVLASFDI